MVPPPRSTRDADDLLLKGFFKTSRGQQKAPSPTITSHSTPGDRAADGVHDRGRPSRTHPRTSRTGWPPKPHVEDEKDVLAREFGEAYAAALQLYHTPCRGVIDQLPIFYESDTTASEHAINEITNPHSAYKNGDNTDRRFVLIPKSDTHAPCGRSKQQPEKPREPVVKPGDNERPRHRKESRDSPPPIARRRSRQDLPSLTTDLKPESPPFRRSTSAYSYKPKREDSTRSARSPLSNAFLSPDSFVGQDGSDGHFDIAAQSLPRKYGGSSPRPASPIGERKPGTGGSLRPPTPSRDRARGSVDGRSRSRGEPVGRSTRSHQSVDETSSRREERSSPRPDRHGSYDRHHSRRPSTQSSNKGYTSSDLDDSEASNSDRRRRRHHRHPSRHADSLYPEHDARHHRRTVSNQSHSNFDAPRKTASMPLPGPRNAGAGPLTAAGLSAGLVHSQRKGTYPPVSEDLIPTSRPDSPYFSCDGKDWQTAQKNSHRRRRQQSPPDIDPLTMDSDASLPMPIRMIDQGRGGTRFHSSQGDENHSSGSSPTKEKDYWQPPTFQPPAQQHHHIRPSEMGCVRRFSEDINDGAIARLLPCPRTSPIRGKTDWLTLPKCRDFNVCPSCYQSAIEPTSYHTFFVPPPFRSLDDEVGCDFGSQPWYRIAWLLLQNNRAEDLSLIHKIAHISATTAPCLGGHEAVRKWYSIRDPDAGGRPVQNFNVCHACVQIVEALLPPTRGLFFIPTTTTAPDNGAPAPAQPSKRTCDLRLDSPRFLEYFDSLELLSTRSQTSNLPFDERAFATLVKHLVSPSPSPSPSPTQLTPTPSAPPPCPKDAEILDAKWYSIAQLPELSVCPACYEQVVRPEAERGRAIACMFALGRQVPVGSCGMYSSRMRGVFREAVERDDYRLLARAARERRE